MTDLVRIALFLCVLAASTLAHAENAESQAREAFQQGVTAFEKGQLAEALDLFHRAYALKPSYRILYNIAQTEAELGRPHKAIATFEAYLAEGGAEVTKKRRKTVEAEIRRLTALVGTLRVDGPAGSDLWIDGEHIGALPLGAPVRLSAGTHRISVQLPGFDPCERSVEVPALGTAAELCEPTPPKPPEPEAPAAPVTLKMPDLEPENSVLLDTVAPWTATGLGAACLIAGTVLAISARSLNNELEGACPKGVCPMTREEDVATLPKLAASADVLFVATAVMTAAATVLFLAPWKKKAQREARGEAP